MSQPDHLDFSRPAVASIEDPEGGDKAGFEEGDEGGARMKELGLHGVSVMAFELSPEEVVKHYSSQAGGKGLVRSKKSSTIISYRVEEGTLLVAVAQKEGKTYVTRALVGSQGPDTPNALPSWMRDALRDQKS